ncbi:hypothetical protein SLEP1_g19430 [Rubroshorea leprosula]|uniref:Uncharacterized protein n=1 Tax=Rubroshorea leprosula TaxID=152421 RepID=A0AAV5J8K2_9ROSI|nr:hypothetical protein SLEP1_g19430 [Rubroshorea leprosula]
MMLPVGDRKWNLFKQLGQDLQGCLRDKPGKSRDYYRRCYCLRCHFRSRPQSSGTYP